MLNGRRALRGSCAFRAVGDKWADRAGSVLPFFPVAAADWLFDGSSTFRPSTFRRLDTLHDS